MKKTKIICSIGPVSSDADTMEKLVNVGMNVARINFSHATIEEREAAVSAVKEVRKRTGKNIGILYDTKGPEFRTGKMTDGKINLVDGKTIRIVKEEVLGTEEEFSTNHPQVLDDLCVGNEVLIEDGLMKVEVISKEEDGVTCRIINGGELANTKSMNVPGVKLSVPFISEQDEFDILYACEHEGDFLALSFVSTKEDVLAARKLIDSTSNKTIKVISKVESTTGMENLDDIISVSDGVMVARGDLGVEVPMPELPICQKKIIRKCREQGKFCIVATEMLASMYTSARPTRAEVSDIFNAVLDGTDAVMLSGETTIGKHPVDAVRYMANIAENAESCFDKKFENLTDGTDTANVIAKSVVSATEMTDIKAVVAATISGNTARKISNLKPECPILAVCTDEDAAHKLALNWGVTVTVAPMVESTDEVIESAKAAAVKMLNLQAGDKIVITGGFPTGKSNTTNLLKIEEI